MRRALPLLALALSACAPVSTQAPPRPPPPIEAAPPPAAPPPPAAEAAQEPPSTPLPPWIARIDSPACSWLTERWSPLRVVELSARPGGPVIARVTGGRARVHVPVGAAGGALADVASNGLAVSGYAPPEQISLYATTAFPMNGVVYPPSSASLSWAKGSEEGVTVTMPAPDGVVVRHPPLAAERPCADLSLDRGARLAPAKAAFGVEYGDRRIIHAGRTLEVFADPARPADVQLVLREDVYADVFAASGSFSRIGAPANGVYVAGWVRTNNLGEEWGGSSGSLSGFGRSGIGAPRVSPVRTVQCGADVPLVAEAGGERTAFGHALAGTPIDVLAEGAPYQPVHIENRDIHPAILATFLARTSDLARCQAIPP